MVGAVGIRIGDDKHMLGFEEPSPENEQVSTRYLRSVGAQGLNLAEGPLVITDGSKGLQTAVRKAFGHLAVIQRCEWHKREHVEKHFPKEEITAWHRRVQPPYPRPTYMGSDGCPVSTEAGPGRP